MLSTDDLDVLGCPSCNGRLELQAENLNCLRCGKSFPITDGIPRFILPGDGYNATWDYKWTHLDAGRGYNFEIIEPHSKAYEIHNVFRFFENRKELFTDTEGRVAIDIGCGTGQYAVSLLQKGFRKVYALDLTRGVDVGKKLVAERYPDFKDRIIFIQGNARHLPIQSSVIDLGMALASIHHSGYLDDCVGEVVRVVKPGRLFFIWIYAKPLIPFSDANRNFRGWIKMTSSLMLFSYIEFLFNLIKRLPESLRMPILRVMASQAVYRLRQLPLLGRWVRYATPGISEHPDRGYRLINLYDAYSPAYSGGSDEGDVIGWSQRFNFDILNFSTWRLGWVGRKR
jgi:ubiquinone/menaquinone biosynthesis C-methylase UbiE/uncharacterized protein YbaR (Trm112 family)